MTAESYNIVCITFATDSSNDGFQTFIHSCERNRITNIVLGLGCTWNGGDMNAGKGGGQKVNLLKQELNTWSHTQLSTTIVLVSDSYDAIIVAPESDIRAKYNTFATNSIVFSSEKSCWPDSRLEKYYPDINSDYKFLNSGGFIGKALDIKTLVQKFSVADDDDDQLLFSKVFLFDNTGNKIVLDYCCKLFQTLHRATDDVECREHIVNKIHQTSPCVIHANGSLNTKRMLKEWSYLIFN